MGLLGEEINCEDLFPKKEPGPYRQQRIELIQQINDESLTREERNAAVWESNRQIPMWLYEEATTFLYNTFLYGWAAEWDEATEVEERYAELLSETGGDSFAAMNILEALEAEGYDTRHLVKGGMPTGGPPRRALKGLTGAAYNQTLGQGVYALVDDAGRVIYVGRGDVPARLAAHARSTDKGHLDAIALWQNNLTKAQAKGLEQRLMDEFGGARSTNPLTNLLNKIRGFSPLNPRAPDYEGAVSEELWEETLKRLGTG